MALTIETLAGYLGDTASTLLAEPPFKHWTFERSVENDLGEPCIDYAFLQDGVDFVCDGDDRLTTIFLYADKSRFFKEGLQDLPFDSTRREVIERFGLPSKSGGKLNDPTLGDYGPWDRFARSGYSIHVEYASHADLISRITLMRADVVPA